MMKSSIRYVALSVLVIAAVGQIGLAGLSNAPADARPAFPSDLSWAGPSTNPSLSTGTWETDAHAGSLTLADESLERALVRMIQDFDVPGLFVLAGAIRNGDGDPLDNEVRAEIHDAVEEESVIRLTRLAADLDVGTSTVRYHVRILDDARMVDVETIWGKRWLSVPTVERTDVLLAAALDDEALASVFEVLSDRDPASVSELAAVLDRAPSTVSYHLQRLANAGLVERERDGSSVRTSLADEIQERLDEES